MGARYYSPAMGRFISEDPVAGSGMMPQTLNPYAYVGNNPLKYTDPTGEFWHIVVGAAVGAAVGGIGCGLMGGRLEQCLIAAGAGAAIGAFAAATFGLGMAAVGLGSAEAIAGATWGTVAIAGAASGAMAGAQTYYFSSTVGMAMGTMSPEDLSTKDFATEVVIGAGLGMAGSLGAKAYIHHKMKITPYTPDRKLPTDPVTGRQLSESDYPHTQLGKYTDSNGRVSPQAREWGSRGELIRDIDFTDHSRPKLHTNPHQHQWIPKSGWYQRVKPGTPFLWWL